MSRVLFLFSLLAVTLVAASDCDPYRESYTLCSQNDRCRFHMYIDAHPDDMDSYREVVDYHPTAKHFIGAAFCSDEGTPLARQIWIENTYQAHHMCGDPNEIYVRDIGCVCRQGRHCNVKNVLDHVLGINRHDLFILVIGLTFVGALFYILNRVKAITAAIDGLQASKRQESASSAETQVSQTRSEVSSLRQRLAAVSSPVSSQPTDPSVFSFEGGRK